MSRWMPLLLLSVLSGCDGLWTWVSQEDVDNQLLEIDLDEIGETIERDEALARGPLGRALLGAYAEAAANDKTGVDLPFLRRGLHRYYQCDRAFPLTLEGF